MARPRHRGTVGYRGDRHRRAVEPQRQAEGRTAAAQERGQRGRHHAIAALGKRGAQARAAARHHHGIAEADGVGGETTPVLAGDLDALLWRDPRANGVTPGLGKGIGQIHDLAARERGERRVHVVEARIREFERDHVLAEHVGDRWRAAASERGP